MRILLVENDKDLLRDIRPFMEWNFDVDTVFTGNEGIHLSLVNEYDTIVIGSCLPDIDEERFCMEIRAAEINSPLIVLSDEESSKKRVKLLEQGVDLVLTKPINVKELIAYIRSVVRRSLHALNFSVISVGDLRINTTTHEVERDIFPMNLRKKEYAILEYLALRSPKAVSSEKIIENVWDGAYFLPSNTLCVHMKGLRDKIDRPFEKPLLKTVYGFGYKLEG
ncbi:response regulator transcription factor [Patescibacteria group bacterium]